MESDVPWRPCGATAAGAGWTGAATGGAALGGGSGRVGVKGAVVGAVGVGVSLGILRTGRVGQAGSGA